jgi:hypothetical protein
MAIFDVLSIATVVTVESVFTIGGATSNPVQVSSILGVNLLSIFMLCIIYVLLIHATAVEGAVDESALERTLDRTLNRM